MENDLKPMELEGREVHIYISGTINEVRGLVTKETSQWIILNNKVIIPTKSIEMLFVKQNPCLCM